RGNARRPEPHELTTTAHETDRGDWTRPGRLDPAGRRESARGVGHRESDTGRRAPPPRRPPRPAPARTPGEEGGAYSGGGSHMRTPSTARRTATRLQRSGPASNEAGVGQRPALAEEPHDPRRPLATNRSAQG